MDALDRFMRRHSRFRRWARRQVVAYTCGMLLARALEGWTFPVALTVIQVCVLSLLGFFLFRRAAPVLVLPAPEKPRLELKAPNPRPGQCPVCSLEDLDARAADDAFMGDTGTELARVVAYGPDRAHSECAAVVPYVPPSRSTSGGTAYQSGGYVRPVQVGAQHCPCSQCRAGHAAQVRPRKGGYMAADVTVEQMGPVPEVLTKPGPAKRGKLREAFIAAMAEEAAAAGEKLVRELGMDERD